MLESESVGMKTVSVVLRLFCLCVLALGLMMPEANAQTLNQPKGPVVLTVSGLIGEHNAGNTAVFDLAMLKALAQAEFATKTPWQETVSTFRGPSLQTLLAAVGATGHALRLTALDKYEATLPLTDVKQYEPLLALQVDGKPLTVRSRGPVLVMYPFDRFPQINTDIYAGRAVWQLQRIVVE